METTYEFKQFKFKIEQETYLRKKYIPTKHIEIFKQY